jgi:UDP-glucuronate decarboxylase
MESTSKTVLITGGAGFIGSHLCDYYISEGYHVLCMDNLFTGREENIQHLRNERNFEFVLHDVTEPFFAKVDLILNFACPASPVHYQYDPIKTLKTSVIGTLNMLGLAKKNGARILHASTSEVYGDPHVHPQPENYWGNVNCTGPRSCYDEGKRAAETLCFDYYREHSVDIRVIRIFNTYGPRMAVDDGRVVSNFICQALKNEDLTVYGDGSQTRSFCYVDDLVRGITKMMDHDDFIGPVNLGNEGEFTVRELAEKVIAKVGGTSKVVQKPLPLDDPKVRRPCTDLALEKLAWKAEIALDKGLDPTIAYYRSVLNKK